MWLQKAVTRYLQEEIAMVHSPVLEKKKENQKKEKI